MLQIVLDLVLVALMAATIGYAVMLSRRLAHLRQARAEMDKTIADFDGATARAEDSISRLKSHASSLGGDLDRRIQRAQALRDELAFLVERAEERSEDLSSAIRAKSRKARPGTDAFSNVNKSAPEKMREAAPGVSRELLETLQNLR